MKESNTSKVDRKCKHCGKGFKVYPSVIKNGRGKFCSISCATTYRNLNDNPAKKKEVREKISKNHADFSGENNPMYGVSLKGEANGSYIDGRKKYGKYYRMVAFENLPHVCNECGKEGTPDDFDVHHKDGNHENNDLSNLEILCCKCHLTKRHDYIRDEKGRFKGVV